MREVQPAIEDAKYIQRIVDDADSLSTIARHVQGNRATRRAVARQMRRGDYAGLKRVTKEGDKTP